MPQQRRRNRVISGLLALGLLAGAALTAGPAQAVDAVGPYYAKPAWDQSLPASTRFVVLTNWGSQAVLDKETGLVWERAPAIQLIWAEARRACTALTTGGRKGWRLPSILELMSLIDPSAASPGPKLPLGHPFTNISPSGYWSAMMDADVSSNAWNVDFGNGNVGSFSKGNGFLSWCVRGG
jgi:hypothetical protein